MGGMLSTKSYASSSKSAPHSKFTDKNDFIFKEHKLKIIN